MSSSFNFMQLADTQFGMFAAVSAMDDSDFEQLSNVLARILPEGTTAPRLPRGITTLEPEKQRYAAALNSANDLRPAFVVVCGDMVHIPDSTEQYKALRDVGQQLADTIPLHLVPGNHDLALDFQAPTPDLLSEYRGRYGPDYYSFDHDGTLFLALNSETLHHPDVPDEAEQQFDFLRDELSSQRAQDAQHIVAFMHTPLFWRDPDDAVGISSESRSRLLELFRAHSVDAVFAGHLHLNSEASDSAMQMVVSGAVGYPFDGQSGYRVVEVGDDGISHEFHPFEDGLAAP